MHFFKKFCDYHDERSLLFEFLGSVQKRQFDLVNADAVCQLPKELIKGRIVIGGLDDPNVVGCGGMLEWKEINYEIPLVFEILPLRCR